MLMTAAILLAFFSIPPPLHVSAEGTPSPQPCDGVQGQLAVAGGEDSSPIDFQLRAVGRGGSGAVTTGSLFSSVGRDDAGHLQHELCLQNSKCYALSISGWGAPLDDGIEYSFADPHGAALSRCAPPMRVRCEYSSLVARARIVFYGDPPEKWKCLSINTNLVVMYPVARYPSFKQLPPLTRVLVFSRVYSARPNDDSVSPQDLSFCLDANGAIISPTESQSHARNIARTLTTTDDDGGGCVERSCGKGCVETVCSTAVPSVSTLPSPSPSPMPTPDCEDVQSRILQYDSGGNGWGGAEWRIRALDRNDTVVANGTLLSGDFGGESVCLSGGECYRLELSGGDESSYNQITYSFIDAYGSAVSGCVRTSHGRFERVATVFHD